MVWSRLMLSKDDTILYGTVKGKRRGGQEKTILKSGQEWTLPAQLGQLKTGQVGKGLLRSQMWCPNNLALLYDRME